MNACDALDDVARDPLLASRITYRRSQAAIAGHHAAPAAPLHPEMAERLAARGIDELWGHQAAGIDALRARRDVVVTTSTGSGKSLCFQVPIVESVLAGEAATALLVYPTKALAQDQLRSLRSWLVPGLKAVTYDGDTTPEDRAWARRHANVILTNPEMLHQAVLPNHARWATFLVRLRYVVVDELHSLRGIFGTHVAQVLRRLERMCAHYGSSPTFCFTSATIGNPGELAQGLCGRPVDVVDDDTSPRAASCFALWERPLVDPHTGRRAPANREASMLLERLVRARIPTLAFTRSRRGAETVAATTRRALSESAPDVAARVAAYRAGYLPEERRDLEARLSDGRLLGVAATNALELGIDVSGLDAVIVNGFPSTVASLRQQIGRAGRAGRPAAAILVAGDDQLDQWYARHPDELFDRPAEPAVINPHNPFVSRAHIACAAAELPLTHDDEAWFGAGLDETVRELVHDDLLAPRRGRMHWIGPGSPAAGIGLRSGSSVEYRLVSAPDGRLIGTMDESRVFSQAHEGAIYVHQGARWRVQSLDLRDHVARLESADNVDEHTLARVDLAVTLDAAEVSAPCGAGTAVLGRVTVTSRVTGYRRTRTSTGAVIENVELDLPPDTLPTRACWYTLPAAEMHAAEIDGVQLLSSVHAAEHALIGLLPLFAICDRWDVGGLSMADHPDTGQPTIVVYDGYPGGAGIADLAYSDVPRHIGAALELVAACPCDDGCPSCIQSPKCGNWNEYLDKAGAVAVLRALGKG